jgi:hypothetical protein
MVMATGDVANLFEIANLSQVIPWHPRTKQSYFAVKSLLRPTLDLCLFVPKNKDLG